METNIFSTLVVLVILIFIVVMIIRKMIKDKKAGKSIQCGCDCKKCNRHCNM